MKTTLAIIAGLCLTGFLANAAEKPARANQSRSKIIEKYDKNSDGKLDETEREAMRKDRQSEVLKKYDKNGDGKLDQTERAAAKEDMKKQREAAGERKLGGAKKKEKKKEKN